MIYDDDLPFGYLTVCELDFMAIYMFYYGLPIFAVVTVNSQS